MYLLSEFDHSNRLLRVAVPLYFFTITATWYLGMFEVMPALCKDSEDDSALFLQRVLMVVIYLEMMLNWLCIRYIDSSYFAYLRDRWRKRSLAGPQVAQRNGDSRNGLLASVVAVDDDYRSSDPRRFGDGPRGGDDGGVDSAGGGGGGGGGGRSFQQHGGGGGGGMAGSPDSALPPWKPAFRPSQQKTYPYWSWVPCYVCEVLRPPRCHHCPVCQTCVLKRDHHCYFAGSCVGWRNQRHFLIFAMWALFGCSYATFHSVYYFRDELWPLMSWWDVFAPFCLARWLLGYVPGMVCLCVAVQTLLVYFILLTLGFVHEHLTLIHKGLTSFEVSSLKKTIELRDTRRLAARFRSVLGRYWLLNLLFPLHALLEAEEDPENWPSIKVYRH